jgi:exosortase/archaeosortase family protein
MIEKKEIEKKLNNFLDEFKAGYEESVEQHPKLGSLAPFIFKLFLAGLVFRAILFIEPDTYIFQKYLAETTTIILNSMGGSYQLQNALIIGENGNYLVTRDCLGWKSVSAFIGLVFASTSNFRKHIKMVLGGISILLFANLVRIVTTVWLSEIGVISFEIIHTFLWRWGMTVLVLLTWYVWLKKYRQPEI